MDGALRLLFHTIKNYRYNPPKYNRSEFASQCVLDHLTPRIKDGQFQARFVYCDPYQVITQSNRSVDTGYKMEVKDSGYHIDISLSRSVLPLGQCALAVYQSADDFLDFPFQETRELPSPQVPIVHFLNPQTSSLKFQHRYREQNAPTKGYIYPPLLFCMNDYGRFVPVEEKLPPIYEYDVPIPDPRIANFVFYVTAILPIFCTLILLVKLLWITKKEQSKEKEEAKGKQMKKKKD